MGTKGNRTKGVFDTNILIDFLRGDNRARDVFANQICVISRIVWMEILIGVVGKKEEGMVRDFLSSFEVMELTPEIAESAVVLRAERNLRLPDAIILATAIALRCPLYTRNTKDFKTTWSEVRVPYRV